jgi:vesicle transport through interaction with t-SNAREs protein 1
MEVKKIPINDRPVAQRDWESKNRVWQNTKRNLVLQSSRQTTSDSADKLADPYHGKLLQGRKILEDTNQSVLRATQVATENEAIGVEVMSELGVQRDALVRTRDRLQDTNQDLTRTHTILRSMNRRVLTNKCLLMVIILMELGILSALCYLKFIKKPKSSEA